MFNGRKLLIATKHGKEKIIAPIVENALGVICQTSSDFDTDLFGTFTGEIERSLDPLSTARNKCREAMSMHDFDLAIASEGSFGPHPLLPFIPANEEILTLLDTKNQLEISVSVLSTETNYHSEEVRTEQELLDFASRAQFPSHKLIIRKSKAEYQDIIKGISDWDQLLTAFRKQIANYEIVYVETDMRAMNNPTRLTVIERAAKDLVNKINSRCPHCNMPGFGITKIIKGLPCSLCKTPTKSTLSQVYTCLHCAYRKEKKYPEHKTMEDPQYCDLCNP
jgi:hypothetical protein